MYVMKTELFTFFLQKNTKQIAITNNNNDTNNCKKECYIRGVYYFRLWIEKSYFQERM